MTIKSKVLCLVILLTFIPLLLLSITLYYEASTESRVAVEDAVEARLLAIRDARKVHIEELFETLNEQVVTLSNSEMTRNAVKGFTNAFKRYSAEVRGVDYSQPSAALTAYYSEQFAAEWDRQNPNQPVDYEALLASLDDEGRALQQAFIAANEHPLGSKHLANHGPDSTSYDYLHKKYHPVYRQYMEAFGFYDIFLVNPDTGHVIYSVYKELDFATSLKEGAFADSGLAVAFNKANELEAADDSVFVDFKPYRPSYNGAAAFIASPVFEGDKKLGILIFQMPVARINNAMTGHNRWEQSGLGKTGETYLVGSDYLARSISRLLIEQPEQFATVYGAEAVQTKEILTRGSNVGIQSIKTIAVDKALAGESGVVTQPGHHGHQVLAAYTPVNIHGAQWALLSEIEVDEAFQPAADLSQLLLVTSIIALLVIALIVIAIGWYFSTALTRPIIKLSRKIEEIADKKDLRLRADIDSRDELGVMAKGFNSMLETFQKVVTEINTATVNMSGASAALSSVSVSNKEGMLEQKQQADQLSVAMNEMVATVNEVASNTSEAARSAESTNQEAQTSNAAIVKTSEQIVELDHELEKTAEVIALLSNDSEKIGQILDVINGIAEQTNLLALNAAIEAARAGDQGRGFAVVADEVRNLAARTQESTHQVGEIISGLQSRSNAAVTAMTENRQRASLTVEQAREAQARLTNIMDAIKTISDMNIQIATASEEQASVAEEINRNVMAISHISETSLTGSEQVAEASKELMQLGEKLKALGVQFKS